MNRPSIIGVRLSAAAFGNICNLADHDRIRAAFQSRCNDWPSNAIILTALVRYARGPLLYPLLLAGGAAASALAGLAAGNSPIFCVALFAANIVEVVTALVLLKLLRVGVSNLTSLRNLLVFIAIGGIAPIGSTIIATTGFHEALEIPWAAVARNWYSGHALGMIIVVPFLISATSKERHAWRIGERTSEAATILAIFIAMGFCVIFFRPFVFLLAPAILLATLRFGIIGATTSTFLVAIIASLYAVLGIGHPMIANADISRASLPCKCSWRSPHSGPSPPPHY